MLVKRWIEEMQAIGLQATAGRYGGTYAHEGIAMEFTSWLSPVFKLYVLAEFKCLKSEEAKRQGLTWGLKRQFSKINYRLHTKTVRKFLGPKDWPDK